ncbi:MAG: hypothetical protein CMP48_25980 [Rickettsiales bacterium]|nr:hypothetical protein [Rickettsiales bacterium]|tara:strand:+ start:17 stop:328 length:312 start_codon:yes stop_codon:yes gene_type:complete
MLKERFAEQLSNFQDQYVPDGRIDLLEGDDIRSDHLLSELPLLEGSSAIYIQKNPTLYIYKKITPHLILRITANEKSYNVGILKSVAGKISQSIRSNAITSNI